MTNRLSFIINVIIIPMSSPLMYAHIMDLPWACYVCVCERVFVCSSPCALRFAYPMIYPPGYVHTYTYYYVTIEWRINRRAYFNPIFGCCIIPHSIRLHPPATYTRCEFSPKYLLCTYYPPIYMSIYKTSIYQPTYVPLYMIVMRVAAATALMTDWQFE